MVNTDKVQSELSELISDKKAEHIVNFLNGYLVRDMEVYPDNVNNIICVRVVGKHGGGWEAVFSKNGNFRYFRERRDSSGKKIRGVGSVLRRHVKKAFGQISDII